MVRDASRSGLSDPDGKPIVPTPETPGHLCKKVLQMCKYFDTEFSQLRASLQISVPREHPPEDLLSLRFFARYQ